MRIWLHNMLWGVWGVVSLLACVAPPDVWGQIYREALVKTVPPLVAEQFRDRGDGVLWEDRLSMPKTLYLRLQFSEITSPPGAQYTVILRAADGKEFTRYAAEQFSRSSSLYTGVLFTDTVKVQVRGTLPLTGLSFQVKSLIHQVDPVGRLTPQSVVPTWKTIVELPKGSLPVRAADSVAKLYIGPGYACSGFLISPKALLTNFHCLQASFDYQLTMTQSQPECGDIEIHFDFDRQKSLAGTVRTPCVRVLSSDAEQGLDYALLEIDPRAAAAGRTSPRGYLKLAARPLSPQGDVLVIHHPAGLPKKFSLACTAYASNDAQLLEHTCSTTGGSSGAPLMSQDGTVVGLHFAGAFSKEMTIEQINNAIAEGAVFRNKAKPAHLILQRLRAFVP